MIPIGILSGKGGSGKSALAFNLAHALAKRGRRVIAIDLDLVDAPSDRIAIRLYRRQVEREPVNA